MYYEKINLIKNSRKNKTSRIKSTKTLRFSFLKFRFSKLLHFKLMSISDREIPLVSKVLLWACQELWFWQSEISILCLNPPEIHKTCLSLPVLCEGLAPRVIHWYVLSIYWSRDQNPCVHLPHDYPTQQTKESCLFILSVWPDEYFILSCKVE